MRVPALTLLATLLAGSLPAGDEPSSYAELRRAFESPDHARWGEVPLWWWEGAPMTRERVTWQLETLAAKGVRSVCPIQRSPARCDPPSFAPEWWDLFAFVNEECRRLGMTLWAYDQVGYGHYGWLEKAAARVGDTGTSRVAVLTAEGRPGEPARLELPAGKVLGARAYPLASGAPDDAASMDIADAAKGERLEWEPAEGAWKVAVVTAAATQSFYLCAEATETFIDMFYGEIERRLGRDSIGSSFVGIFQDEHPPTPRDIWTPELDRRFRERCGYDIARAIPALHFDVGPLTPKYRTDYLDVYLELVEDTYWKRIHEWTWSRGLLTSHDNWGRNDIRRQSQGYIDYFRSQRWFSAPGYDDAGQGSFRRRNYYDTKIAASIARLYDRPRVWNEAFHSSGWGRTTEQTLTWLSTGFAFGCNQYDEHGLYYDTRASTWEHAAPDPHWRQPYWRYYGALSDWVARTSFLVSQGTHVVDAAVHYPVVSLLAGELPGVPGPDPNHYMRLSRTIYDAGIDNDIVDDDSILRATAEDGALRVAGNSYRALVFGPETTVRRAVVEKALALARSGGLVLFFGRLPAASTEGGRGDPELAALLAKLLGRDPGGHSGEEAVRRTLDGGGVVEYVPPGGERRLPEAITAHVERDFQALRGRVHVHHRRIGELHVYLLQNAEDTPIDLVARLRARGAPELWDPSSGEILPVEHATTMGDFTWVEHRIEGNTARLLVLRPGSPRGGPRPRRVQPELRALPDAWTFTTDATRDNRWGEYRWPPSEERIGPEVRVLRHAEDPEGTGEANGWHRPEFDASSWREVRYSTGPGWLALGPVPGEADVVPGLLDATDEIRDGAAVTVGERTVAWSPVEYSRTIGRSRAAPWGGHSGYPDGHVDKNFIHLPEGRKILFTRLRSRAEQRAGLRIELRNSRPRLWVNGVEQPLEDAVGNLPLRAGENTVLLDLPDGGTGRLFVQAAAPSVDSMEAAARGAVAPDLEDASWIWSGDTGACYVRKTFSLERRPVEARVVVTAYSGYRLLINGRLVEEEIGPWAHWDRPETLNVAPLLGEGDNVIAIWGQLFAGQNVNRGDVAFRSRGIALALRAREADGSEWGVETDGSWRGSTEDLEGWETVGFDDSGWAAATVRGRMGDAPWGRRPLENVGLVTEPKRPLSIHLASPYLTCFDEMPDIVHDVKAADAPRVGWYRFLAPPGLRAVDLRTRAGARVWVDDAEATVREGVATVGSPPDGTSTVAIRLEMEPGAYGGAAFAEPLALTIGGGRMPLGDWTGMGLPTYSGVGVYSQTVRLRDEDVGSDRRTILDLGQVLVAAEVLVNGQSVGVALARPFRFDISRAAQAGENRIEVRVANTIAPHYTTIPAHNLGPTASGLIGPVTIRTEVSGSSWRAWALEETERLLARLSTPTPELLSAQRRWEPRARWEVLRPSAVSSTEGTELRGLEDGSLIATGSSRPRTDSYTLRARLPAGALTGLRLEAIRDDSLPGRGPGRARDGSFVLTEIDATLSPEDGGRVSGRFVRIDTQGRPEYLALAEVQVFAGRENVARAAAARQSATSHGGDARLAIDGDTDGAFGKGSVTHTPTRPAPWWEVDLGSPQPVDRIVIWNRTDQGLEERLHDIAVTVLDGSRQPVWSRVVTEPPRPTVALRVGGPIPLDLAHPVASTSRADAAVALAIDGDPATGWSVAAERPRETAIFPVGSGVRLPAGTLEIRLDQRAGGGRTLGRFRVSTTRSERPRSNIPLEIDRILALPPAGRSEAQEGDLARFFRSICPQLEPTRERLRALRRELDGRAP